MKEEIVRTWHAISTRGADQAENFILSVTIVLARSDVTAFIGSIYGFSLFFSSLVKKKKAEEKRKTLTDIIRAVYGGLCQRIRAATTLDSIKNGIRGQQRGYVTWVITSNRANTHASIVPVDMHVLCSMILYWYVICFEGDR